MPLLLLLFILVPVAEIALFIEIGGAIGTWSTLGVIVITALIGTALVRQQGLQTLTRAQAKLDRSEIPVEEVVTGVCLLVAGALLLTPGFLTDAVGFVLLIAPLRRALGTAAFNYLKRHGKVHVGGGMHGQTPGGGFESGGMRTSRPGEGPIIDGDYTEVDPPKGDPDPSSPWAGGSDEDKPGSHNGPTRKNLPHKDLPEGGQDGDKAS